MAAYKKVIANKGLNLSDGKKLDWKSMRILYTELARMERDNLRREHQQRDAMEKRPIMIEEGDDELAKKLDLLPVYNRAKEKYINPFDDDWERRYYATMFDCEQEDVKQICVDYLKTIEWTFKYYTEGCIDWRWQYKHLNAPLMTDIVQAIPVFDIDLIEKSECPPVSALTQLSYVLPLHTHYLLPDMLRHELLKDMEEVYGDNYEVDWNYCKYFWESHVKLPEIDLERLETITERFVGLKKKR
jgi:5'-3' exonuclease